jgi:hypothetical protein
MEAVALVMASTEHCFSKDSWQYRGLNAITPGLNYLSDASSICTSATFTSLGTRFGSVTVRDRWV